MATVTFTSPKITNGYYEIITYGAGYDTVFVKVSVNDLQNNNNPVVHALVYSDLPDPIDDEPPAGATTLDLDSGFHQKLIPQGTAGDTMSRLNSLDLPDAYVVAWFGWRDQLTDPITWETSASRRFFVHQLNNGQ